MDAKEKLRAQLDILFADAPRTRAAYELQEELLANCLDKYEDLVRQGTPEEQALENVIGSIGDVNDLIAALPGEKSTLAVRQAGDEHRRKSATITAIAIALYFLAGIVFFICAWLSSFTGIDSLSYLSLILAALIAMVPTCMLVYNARRYPKYEKTEETLVEDFKAWNSESKKMKSLRGAISSLIWTLTVVLYFIISFVTMAWPYTWIIFLIAVCAEAVVTLVFRFKEL